MGKYLDPKSDVVFKKIFGNREDLLKSFLNALLPLPDDGQIETLEYLPTEHVPDIPVFKSSIVDVKCKDQQGKIFIVEMQIEWTDSFMQRLLFGAAQAYVKQLKTGEDYRLLNPVYGLGLINSVFDRETPEWYHHYGLVKLTNHQEKIIKGLSLVFVEIPKFQATSRPQKQLQVLWLRFMREITGTTRTVAPELLEVPEIKEAIRLSEESAYSIAELDQYETYWKHVSSERTLIGERTAQAEAKGEAKGRIEGTTETQIKIARAMKIDGLEASAIAKFTNLSLDEIGKL